MEDDVEGSGSRGSDDPPMVTEGDDIIAEPAEDAPIKVATDPGEPTQEEFEWHCLTHLPYGSNSPGCNRYTGEWHV